MTRTPALLIHLLLLEPPYLFCMSTPTLGHLLFLLSCLVSALSTFMGRVGRFFFFLTLCSFAQVRFALTIL